MVPRSDPTSDAYDVMARLYAELFLDNLDGDTNALGWLATFAELAKARPGPVVDMGCGPGHVADHLTALGLTVVALDRSQGQLHEARQAFPHLSLLIGDLGRLGVPGQVLGGILSRYSIIHHQPAAHAHRSVFAEWRRVLMPGAPLLLSFFGSRSATAHGTPFDHKVITAYELFPVIVAEQLTDAGFSDIEIGVVPPGEGGRPLDQATILARA